jgi:hypothetical protein
VAGELANSTDLDSYRMVETFTRADLIGTASGFLLFFLFLFVPGYVSGWLLDLFGFRARGLLARCAIATPVSVGIFPAITYLLWRWSIHAVWALYASLFIAFLILVVYDWRVWLRRPSTSRRRLMVLAIVAGWVVLGTVCLVDMQIGDRLYFSSVANDYMFRTAVTSSVSRTGVPPHNPYYFPGHAVPLRYHYFWYLQPSLVEQLGGVMVAARHAMLASTLWSGIGLMAAVAMYLRFFRSDGAIDLDKRMLAGIALLSVTGLDILPAALFTLLGHPLPNIDVWNEQVTSWVTSVFWVPHHVASLVACLTGFLVLWYDSVLGRSAMKSGVIAGVMFASAAGLSVYVTLVFAAFVGIWAGIRLLKRSWREVAGICVSGVVAVAFASPYLLELRGGSSGQSSGGGPMVQLTVRQFYLADEVVRSFCPGHEGFISVVDLLLLPVNYFLELGFFFAVGAVILTVWWPNRRVLRRDQVCGFIMLATSVVLCTFLRSGVITNNDLGWRGFLPAQFILLIWGAELFSSGLFSNPLFARWRFAVVSLLILGVAGSLYEVFMVRLFYVVSGHHAFSGDTGGKRTYALREVYERVNTMTGPNAIVQQNPNGSPGDVYYGLYADHQTAAETLACGAIFGGDPRACGGIIDVLHDVFDTGTVDASAIDGVCGRLSINILVVKDLDPVWKDAGSWVWHRQPLVANDFGRAYGCGGGDLNSPRAR